jgi:hypothetical protein
MRLIPLLMIVLLAACQGTKSEPDYSAKPKTCDTRASDSGFCVPGEYEQED